MTPNENIHTLAGAYALDSIDDLERLRFEAHLDHCASCSEEVSSFLDTTAMLGAVDHVDLSPALRAAVLENLDSVRQVGPMTARVTRRAPRLMSVAAAVLAFAVVGLSVVTAGLRREVDDLEPYRDVAAIIQAEDAITLTETIGSATVKIVASPGSGTGAVLANGMSTAPNGHAYQLWLLTSSGEALPAGFLAIGEDGTGEEIMRGEMEGVIAIGITVEPDGGSEAPTTEPIAVLPLSA
jgi:anti-sigma-K factor RskA